MVEWDDLNHDEKLACISLFPEQAKNDDSWKIILEWYKALGFTEEAKQDRDGWIRLSAYRILGFTKESLEDEYELIRHEAEIYFQIKNKLEGKDKSNNKSEVKIIKEIYEKIKKYLGE